MPSVIQFRRDNGTGEYLEYTCRDYSEEAIPERDPRYRDWNRDNPSVGTDSQALTVGE